MSTPRRLPLASAFVALLSCALGVSALQTAPPPAADAYATKIQPLLVKYCYKCHGPASKPKADLNLAKYFSEASIRENRKIWKEVLTKTLGKEMPPEEAQPQPTPIVGSVASAARPRSNKSSHDKTQSTVS